MGLRIVFLRGKNKYNSSASSIGGLAPSPAVALAEEGMGSHDREVERISGSKGAALVVGFLRVRNRALKALRVATRINIIQIILFKND